ncbi:hypothetical protein GCM10023191_102140 [Actinoallomurus oryzae]|uniref:Uncharacterized protein n=1 Tax=Actinoallomurus oryzae TaxID=502180 RepID=A0ABP8R9Q5_9ACTN
MMVKVCGGMRRSAIGPPMRGCAAVWSRLLGEFVGGVGAEAADMRTQVGRQRGELVGGDGPPVADQLAEHVHRIG